MTATARQVRTGHWADSPANDSKFPEPADPAIKTKTDMFYALAAWAVGPLVVIGVVSLIAIYFKN